MGLKVEDAAATVGRAWALGEVQFEQLVGPREFKIPMICGVGGNVMQFMDNRCELGRVCEIEFEPVEDPEPSEDARLLTIDHIAQTMRYEEILTWHLFSTSISKTDKTPMVDVVDHAGLVCSQMIENGDGYFFEIVERSGGCRGYGAANAQFRIGAQRRSVEAKPPMIR